MMTDDIPQAIKPMNRRYKTHPFPSIIGKRWINIFSFKTSRRSVRVSVEIIILSVNPSLSTVIRKTYPFPPHPSADQSGEQTGPNLP
jgi:hypothetical protein